MDSEKIGYANTSQAHSLPTQQYDNQNNSPNTKEATFKGLNVNSSENSPETITAQDNTALDDTYKSLQDRRIKNTTKQTNATRLYNLMSKTGLLLFCAIVAFIVTAAVVSPFYAIGIALAVMLTVILSIKNNQNLSTISHCGLQNLSIDMLRSGIQNSNQNNSISEKGTTELLNALTNATNLAYTKNLQIHLANCSYYKIMTVFQEPAKKEINSFVDRVFKDPDLKNNLISLNLDVNTMKQHALNYIDSQEITDIASSVMGNKVKKNQ
jgi:hypothetical protein